MNNADWLGALGTAPQHYRLNGVDIANWFLNAGGTALVDPASANKGQPNESVVRDRIEASIEAFRDDDHDGHDDDGVDH